MTRNANKVSRSLVTTQSRLNQIVDESSDTGKALTQWYEEHNIAIYDQTGQIRSLYDILVDVGEIWPTLTKNEQAYYLNQQAGANQSQNLAAILGNMETVLKATETAYNSAGSAAQENASYMESLEAKVSALKAAFQDLANNVIESDLVKAILELSTSFLNLANTGLGQVLTQFTLLTGVFTGGIALFGKFATSLSGMVSGFASLVKVIPEVIAGTATLTAGFGALSTAALPIAGILAGIVAIGVVVYKTFKDATKPLSDYTQELESSESQLETNKQKLEELNSIPWYDRTPEIESEISALEEENARLEEQIQLLDEEATKKAQKTVSSPVTYSEQQYVAKAGSQSQFSQDVLGIGSTAEEATQNLATNLNTTVEEIERAGVDIQQTFVETSAKGDAFADNFITNAQRVLNASKNGVIDEQAQSEVNQLISAMQDEYIPALEYLDGVYKSTGEEVDGYGEKQQKVLELYNELLPLLQETTEAEEEQTEAAEQTGEELSDLESIVSTYSETLKNASETNKDLKEVLDEVNEGLASDKNWQLPVEVLVEINDLLPETIGQINNATDAQQVLQDAIASNEEVATQAYANMLLSNGDFVAGVIQNSATLQSVLNQNYGIDYSNWKDLDSAKLTADSTLISQLASMWSKYMGMTKQQVQAQLNSFKQFSSYLTENDRKEIQAMESYLAYLDEAEKGMQNLSFSPASTSSKSSKSSGSSSSSAKSTTDAYKQAFDDWLDYKDHQLAMDEITEEEYYTALKQKNEEYFGGKEKYLEEYREYAEKVYKWEKEQAEELAEKAKEAYEEYLDDIKEKLDAVISYVTEYASRQIDALEEQIDAVEDEIDAVNDKYDAKVDALEEQNDALEKQIQLEQYLEALAKAKSTQSLVYKDGQFQYMGDVDSISAAQSDIDTFNREQALEEQKAQIEEQRNNELTQLENSKSALEQEKQRWEEYKEGWANLTSDYEYYQNELIAKQTLGIDLENSNWDTRLNNFSNFNQMYGQYQQMLLASEQDTADAEASVWNQRLADACDFMNQMAAIMGTGATYSYTPVGGSGASKGTSVYGGTTTSNVSDKAYETYQQALASIEEWETNKPEGWRKGDITEGATYQGYKYSNEEDYGTLLEEAMSRETPIQDEIDYLINQRNAKIISEGLEGKVESTADMYERLAEKYYSGSHATGTLSAHGGISLVGEQGPELRVLNSGDGILPNDITSNLWDWGTMSPASLLSSISNALTNGTKNVFNIDNLSLPNVTNAQTLISGLKEMAYQRAYKRA